MEGLLYMVSGQDDPFQIKKKWKMTNEVKGTSI